MKNVSSINFTSGEQLTKVSVESLAQQWAKKYVQNLEIDSQHEGCSDNLSLSSVVSQAGRKRTADNLMDSLRSVSAQAWNKTEALLSQQVRRHQIDSKLINPWEIAADSFKIYEKALNVYIQQTTSRQLSLVTGLAHGSYEKAVEYTEQVAPSQLSTVISADIGAMREKYTAEDPRVIGFVSMQFHYTSQMLLQPLSPLEQALVGSYFKVIDDHLYMPLQRAYRAAGQHESNSPALAAVQQLLCSSTEIAKKIVERVSQLYPTYQSYSGALSKPHVKVSSIRDVEMFQVYLWVCALEGSITAVQQELFGLCVMLYPTLKVQWELIRQMLHLLGQEIQNRLTPEQAATLMPYFQALWYMFSPDVFNNARGGVEKYH